MAALYLGNEVIVSLKHCISEKADISALITTSCLKLTLDLCYINVNIALWAISYTKETLEKGVFFVNFEHILHPLLVFISSTLTLSK